MSDYKNAPKTFALRYSMNKMQTEIWKLFATDGSEHWIRQTAIGDAIRSDPEIDSLLQHLTQIAGLDGLAGQRNDGNLYLPDVPLVQEIVRKVGYTVERIEEARHAQVRGRMRREAV